MFDFNQLAKEACAQGEKDWRFERVELRPAPGGWMEPCAIFSKPEWGICDEEENFWIFGREALMEKASEYRMACRKNPDMNPVADLFDAAEEAVFKWVKARINKAILGDSGRADFKYACLEPKMRGDEVRYITLHRRANVRDAVPEGLPLMPGELDYCIRELEKYVDAGAKCFRPEWQAHYLRETEWNLGEISGNKPNWSLHRRQDKDPPGYDRY